MKYSTIRGATLILALCALSVAGFGQAVPNIANSTVGNNSSYVAGRFVANNYGVYQGQVVSGNASTGSQSITVRSGYIVLPDGRSVVPFGIGIPLVINDAAPELVTPTGVSSCNKTNSGGVAGGVDAPFITCTITASFAAAHGGYAQVLSATNGIAEAQLDAFNNGGGVVTIAPGWSLGLNVSCTNCKGSLTNTPAQNLAAVMAALLPLPSVGFEDLTNSAIQYWYVAQGATTALATPATLTAVTAAPSATPVGAYGTGTYHMCISYVDVMGNEGTCSADFSEAGVATGSFIFTAPAASTGAVGYTIYISLTSGTYALSYKVPLTSSICTLTKIETITAACAVANASYGQSGATATVTAITVNTAMLAPNATVISSTTDYVPNPNARTVYAYVPSNHIGLPGVVSASLPFPVGVAAGSTVPDVIGTLTLPAGFMNFVGKTIEICGYATEASAGSTATISDIQLWWDAAGSNTAGAPVLISTVPMTNTLVTAKTDQFGFCRTLKTTVAGAGVTAGSIQQTSGWYQNQYTSSSVATVPLTVLAQGPAAVGSLNLAGEARIEVVWLHTTGTDGAGVLLQDLTVKVLN